MDSRSSQRTTAFLTEPGTSPGCVLEREGIQQRFELGHIRAIYAARDKR